MLTDTLTRFLLKWWQSLNNTVRFRNGKNTIDAGLIIVKPSSSLFQRRSYSKVCHIVILAYFPKYYQSALLFVHEHINDSREFYAEYRRD
jgi:hypothetical protein